MSREYDIAVVGGGLAGASLACALADTGLSVALIEAVAFDTPADDNLKARTTALLLWMSGRGRRRPSKVEAKPFSLALLTHSWVNASSPEN